MQLDRAIGVTNQLLLVNRQRELSELEILVFTSIWQDISYQQSSQNSNYEMVTIKNTASKLLKDISQATGTRVSKKNCKSIICRLESNSEGQVDWGNAPTDIQPFCGRVAELAKLTEWLTIDRCKLVGILGIGGIGKTALAARLGSILTADFDLIIWRSLRESPPLNQLVGELIQFLSGFTEIEVPDRSDRSIARLLYHLRQKRCAIVLDNVEAIAEAGEYAGNYRSGFADYGQLFHSIGTSHHQSCLLFTSREPPPEMAELAGKNLPVRSFWLSGLAETAPILLSKIGLNGSESQLLAVSERCQGNPLYLRIVANTIVNSFNGEIESFLTANQFTYGKIANVLQSQLDRLSPIEKLIIYHLAIQREPISLERIETHLQPLGYDLALHQTIDSLQQRSLLEVTQGKCYTLQNVVMEFMTAATIRELVTEIANNNLSEPFAPQQELFFFNNLAIYPATSPTYIRDVQQRIIVQPIVDRLSVTKGRDLVIECCQKLLDLYQQAGLIPSYGAGNLIDLSIALAVDLQSYNLTNLYIAEVDFQATRLQNVDFTGVTFDRCRFAQGMGTSLKLTFSPDGKYLAASDTSHQIKIWEVATNQEIALLIGHQSWIWDVQFSADCQYLVSGSSDETMRIWDLVTGECLQVLDGHRDWVWRVSFAFNSNLVISLCADRQLRIWWWRKRLNLLTLTIPISQIRDGSFNSQRGLLAVCGGEGLEIWHVWTGRRLQQIDTEYTRNLRLVSFTPDGDKIFGASFSCTIHCWDVNTYQHLFDLHGHPTQISDINYDDAGNPISTCLEQIRVWNVQTGVCIKAINFGSDCGKGIAYRSPLIATGSDNGAIVTWNLETGKCVSTSTGNSTRIFHLATSPHHQIVATCKDDGTLSLWNFAELEICQIPSVSHFPAHRGMATYLSFSPNGRLIASAGSDRLIQIWNPMTGQKIQTLTGHTDYIAQLLFIDDRTMLSRGYDGTTRQWDIATGNWKSLDYLPHQGRWVMSLAQSPTGKSIVFGSRTPNITIFDRDTGSTQAYPATGNRLRQLTFSHDGRLLIGITDDRILNLWEVDLNYHHCAWSIGDRDQGSILAHPTLAHLLIIGTDDGKISIWDLQDRVCTAQITAHKRDILSIGIVPNPDRLVSCSLDGSIKVWGLVDSGLSEQLYAIESDTPYQNLQLSGVKGLNRSQLDTLVRLGAIR